MVQFHGFLEEESFITNLNKYQFSRQEGDDQRTHKTKKCIRKQSRCKYAQQEEEPILLSKNQEKIKILVNFQTGNMFPSINKLKWDRCTHFRVLLLRFSLVSLLAYFLQYKKLVLLPEVIWYSLQKENKGLGGQEGYAEVWDHVHTHMFHLCLSLIRSIC